MPEYKMYELKLIFVDHKSSEILHFQSYSAGYAVGLRFRADGCYYITNEITSDLWAGWLRIYCTKEA